MVYLDGTRIHERLAVEYDCDRFDISIGGPGGAVELGSAPAVIIERTEHQSGRAVILMRDASSVPALLSEMYRYQEKSGSRWGRNTIEIRDRQNGNLVLICREVAFANPPERDRCELHLGEIKAA